ncbi:MAG: nicotinate-nucleotide adenylyltransferase [Acidimicrobiales bacterium]
MPRRAPAIGIFGGTFDPIHFGHLGAAATVRLSLGLDRMILVVANEPWQKVGERALTPAEDRYAMVEAAVADRPGLVPSRIEIDRGGPSYTIDTVLAIKAEEPGAAVTLVVGSDVADGLDAWHRSGVLRDEVTVAVVDRPGPAAGMAPEGWRVVRVPVPAFDVSSTELRSWLERGRSVDGLVPGPVIRCIGERGLYATGR